jgi:hypothetical protein
MVHEVSYLPPNFSLSASLLDQLSARSGSQRCLKGDEGQLLLILHEVPQPSEPERKAMFFWFDGHHWHGAAGEGLHELSLLLDAYVNAIDRLEATVEEADTAKEIFELIRHAAPLARTTRNFYHALADAVNFAPRDRLLRHAKDRAHEIERAAELLHADARVTLEFMRAESAEEQARSSEQLARLGYRLNLLAGFFLPLVALGGLMGMNVELPSFVNGAFWFIFFGGLIMGGLILFIVGYKTGNRDANRGNP